MREALTELDLPYTLVSVGKESPRRADLARRSYALPTPTRDPAAARCYAKRYQDVERKLCPSGRYQPSCAETMRGHYVAHGAEEGRVYGCSGECDSYRDVCVGRKYHITK